MRPKLNAPRHARVMQSTACCEQCRDHSTDGLTTGLHVQTRSPQSEQSAAMSMCYGIRSKSLNPVRQVFRSQHRKVTPHQVSRCRCRLRVRLEKGHSLRQSSEPDSWRFSTSRQPLWYVARMIRRPPLSCSSSSSMPEIRLRFRIWRSLPDPTNERPSAQLAEARFPTAPW